MRALYTSQLKFPYDLERQHTVVLGYQKSCVGLRLPCSGGRDRASQKAQVRLRCYLPFGSCEEQCRSRKWHQDADVHSRSHKLDTIRTITTSRQTRIHTSLSREVLLQCAAVVHHSCSRFVPCCRSSRKSLAVPCRSRTKMCVVGRVLVLMI